MADRSGGGTARTGQVEEKESRTGDTCDADGVDADAAVPVVAVDSTQLLGAQTRTWPGAGTSPTVGPGRAGTRTAVRSVRPEDRILDSTDDPTGSAGVLAHR